MKFLRTTAKHLRLVEKSNLSSSSNAHPSVNNSTYHEVLFLCFDTSLILYRHRTHRPTYTQTKIDLYKYIYIDEVKT